MKKLEKISSSDMDKVIKNNRKYAKLFELYEKLDEIVDELENSIHVFSSVSVKGVDENDDEVDCEVEIYETLFKIKESIFYTEMRKVQRENNRILCI